MAEKSAKQEYKDSRALKEVDLEKFIGTRQPDLSFFIDFVKNHDELELCFRGNSTNNPCICIYLNNHVVFKVKPTGLLTVSFNHARYCKEWEEYLKELIKKYNFALSKENHYYYNSTKDEFVFTEVDIIENNTHEIKYRSKDIGDITCRWNRENPLDFNALNTMYDDILKPIFIKFFDVQGKKNVPDYFKLLDNGEYQVVKVPGKKEKCQQQKLFSFMKFKDNGYFFYDMEFSQRHKNAKARDEDVKIKQSNKPDMHAVQFEKGKPLNLVSVEVKCTREAMEGDSGLPKHYEGMKSYNNKLEYLQSRRKEACQILNQYARLGLRGLTKEDRFNLEDFPKAESGLKHLFIFTGEAVDVWKEKKYDSIRNDLQPVNLPLTAKLGIEKIEIWEKKVLI